LDRAALSGKLLPELPDPHVVDVVQAGRRGVLGLDDTVDVVRLGLGAGPHHHALALAGAAMPEALEGRLEHPQRDSEHHARPPPERVRMTRVVSGLTPASSTVRSGLMSVVLSGR
jgi:hypothetical protein